MTLLESKNEMTLLESKKRKVCIHAGCRPTLSSKKVVDYLMTSGYPQSVQKKMKPEKTHLVIARYAVAVLARFMQKFQLGDTPEMNKYPDLKKFISQFVLDNYTNTIRLKNVQEFQEVFRINPIDEVVQLETIRSNPMNDQNSIEKLWKFVIQVKPLTEFTTEKDLMKLKAMSNSKIERLLAPTGIFNPRISPPDNRTMLSYAKKLVQLFRNKRTIKGRMRISILVQELRRVKPEEITKALQRIMQVVNEK